MKKFFALTAFFLATSAISRAERGPKAVVASRAPAAVVSPSLLSGRIGFDQGAMYEIKSVDVDGKVCVVSFVATSSYNGGVATALQCFDKGK